MCSKSYLQVSVRYYFFLSERWFESPNAPAGPVVACRPGVWGRVASPWRFKTILGQGHERRLEGPVFVHQASRDLARSREIARHLQGRFVEVSSLENGATSIAGWFLLGKVPSFDRWRYPGYPYDSASRHVGLL